MCFLCRFLLPYTVIIKEMSDIIAVYYTKRNEQLSTKGTARQN